MSCAHYWSSEDGGQTWRGMTPDELKSMVDALVEKFEMRTRTAVSEKKE